MAQLDDILRQIANATAANQASQAQADARLTAMTDAVAQQMQLLAASSTQQQQQSQQQQQQMQAAFDQMSTALQASQAQQQAMSQELIRLQQAMAAGGTGSGAGPSAAAAGAAGPSTTSGTGVDDGLVQGRTLIDTKGLGTPQKFNGVNPKFATWSTKLTSWLSAQYTHAEVILQRSATHGELPINAPDVARIEVDSPGAEKLNKQLLTLLTALCEDGAFTLVQNARQFGGLDAWRRLSRRFDPQTPMKSVFALMKLLNQSAVPLEKLLESIESWEEQYRVWALASKMDLPDIVRQMALIMMTSEPLRGHIELTIENYDDYDELRTFIERYVTTKTTRGDDMEVGALGSSPSGGGDKSNIRCHWCDRTGHVVKECRIKLAGKPKTPEALARAEANKKAKSSSQWNQSTTTWKGKGGGGKGGKGGKGKGKGVNSFDADGDGNDDWWNQGGGTWSWSADPDESTPAVSGLALNSIGVGLGVVPELLRLGAGGASWCGQDQYGWYFEATVDSGAAITAGPEALAVKAPLQPSSYAGQAFSTASGEPILPLGVRQLAFQTSSGEFVTLKIEICNVDKFLLSVNDLVEQDHEAIFSRRRPRIVLSNGRAIRMTRARKLFFLRLYLSDQKLMAIDINEDGPAEEAQPFHRLVQ